MGEGKEEQKKRDFYELIPKLPENRRKELEELESNDLVVDFDEEREVVFVGLWKKGFIFDQKGYKIFEKLWDKGAVTIKDGYLFVKDRDYKDLMPVHRHLKIKEVTELAKRIGCPEGHIHVHHWNGHPEDNRLGNLFVCHKDRHAREHGKATWREFQIWRKQNVDKKPSPQ